ncbi:MAG: hypothetical protein A2168_02970 [Planctomycetes bacterium RBG_13_50_24]|nr:MAG: hypothetical protein A2168_02970 [Planctomycetes bacterium RBG_13_50_24]
MKEGMNLLFFMVLFLLLSSGSTLLAWTEPVPVTRVNTEYGDRTPFLSYDGLTLYFSRVDTPDFYYARIYQAIREYTSAPFTEVIEISSLNYSDGHVHCSWVSPDNLRMYYHRTESGSRHRLKVSIRESINDKWPQGTNISELNTLGNINDPSLTQDELTIVFMSNNITGSRGKYDLYIATRPDLNSPFGNLKNLTELNTLANDVDPFISPDGLSLYFTSDINGYYRIYKATRESSEESFGAIEHLSFFDTYEANSRFPAISSDGNTFYFCRELEGEVVSADIYVSYISDTFETKTYYIDTINGDDLNDGLSTETAFATIQTGIDSARDCDKVLVYPGVYTEEIRFKGKAITVQSTAGAAILENPGNIAVSFRSGEGLDSVLKNFIVRNSSTAVAIVGSSPAISNLTVVDNQYGIEAYAGAKPDISNCIFWNNTNNDLLACHARYSCTKEAGIGEGNIDTDPLFVDPDNGDYHLLSKRGRYWPEHDIWVLDNVTSPCIDCGDPAADPSGEPIPNGARINMGAYGRTPYASMSEMLWFDADVNGDGVVDLSDMMELIERWLDAAGWSE